MRIGDKVVCINDNNLYRIPVKSICEGIIYTLSHVFVCACGNVYVRLAEVNIEFSMWCPDCNVVEDTTMYFHVERFRRLDEISQSQKETIAIEEPALDTILENTR